MNTKRIAIAQFPPAFGDLQACTQRAIELIGEASAAGADLVVFSETWIPGFPVWVFGSTEWGDPQAAEMFRRYAAASVAIDGPEIAAIAQAAKVGNIDVVLGCSEVDTSWSRGTMFNSLVFITSEGTIAGVHRKLVPTHAERLVWGNGDAAGLTVHEMKSGRVGGLVCWEHWMPLARYTLHSLDEQIHVAVWPENETKHELACRHYAFEGRCFVICAAQILHASDVPEAFTPASGWPQATLIPGGSGVVGPDGEWIVGPIYDTSEMIFADINLDDIPAGFFTLDSAGHYNRPDIFDVRVNRRRTTPLTFES
jgi:nitrilase